MSRKSFSLTFCWMILIGISTLTVSCSGGLSRSEAAKLIPSNEKFSQAGEEYVFLGFCVAQKLCGVLFKLGYIESNDNAVTLTEKGRQEATKWKPGLMEDRYTIPLAQREVIEVTGISESKSEGNVAQATFTWRWKPTNEIGKAMSVDTKIYSGSATFQKFDDGWRVGMVSGEGIPP